MNNLQKYIKTGVFVLFILGAIGFGVFHHQSSNLPNPLNPIRKLSFGIVVPMEHAALTEIVEGFKEEILLTFPKATFNVQNAQGDFNLQRSIIQQFVSQKVDAIVPIGMAATQMTASLVKQQPIVSLAADYPESDRVKRNPINLTGVVDEIGAEKQIQFIHAVFPQLKKISLIYSNSEKVFPEVEEAVKEAQKQGITVQKLMIQNLSELYSISSAIASDSEAIYILKDHLVVSGIRALVKEAGKRKMPVITSDEGSIQEGGTFALGVKERAIGQQGGRLAVKVMKGDVLIQDCPIESMKDLSIFYNPYASGKVNLDVHHLEKIATENHYKTISLGTGA